MKQNKSSRKIARRAQRGFGLFEMALAAVIAAGVLGVVYYQFKASDTQSKIQNEAQQAGTVVAAIKGAYQTSQSFAGLSNTTIQNAVPQNMQAGAGLFNNSWGGSITVSPANVSGGTSNAFQLVYTNIPADACQGFVPAESALFLAIKVNSTDVQTVDAPSVDVDATATACTAGGAANTITFIGK